MTRWGSRRKFHTYLKVCVCQRAGPIRSKEFCGKVDDKSCVRVPLKAVVCKCGWVALAEDCASSEPVFRIRNFRSPLGLFFSWLCWYNSLDARCGGSMQRVPVVWSESTRSLESGAGYPQGLDGCPGEYLNPEFRFCRSHSEHSSISILSTSL
jgi:hypothetical protein